MPWNYERFSTSVAAVLSRIYENETGRVLLTFFTEGEEDQLHVWYAEGVKPKVAAHRIIDARRHS